MNENSNTFCMFPWIHLSIQPNGEVLPCCSSSSLSLYFKDKTLYETWNSKEIKNLRLNMLNNIRSTTCEHCYITEKIGQQSPRQFVNRKYRHHLDIVQTTKNDGTVDKLNLIYWDFRFNNVCNFKCRMCGPVSSTSWYEDYYTFVGKKYNGGKTEKIDILHELDPLFDIVEEIYFAGGEPLIMEEHYYILEKLIELGKTDVPITYSTNLSTFDYKNKNVLNIWKKFKNIVIGISLDGYGKKGELIRSGLNWERFLKNLISLKNNVPQAECLIGSTVQVLNSFHIMDTQRKLFDLNLLNSIDDFRVQFLSEPEFLSLQILDKNTKKNLCNKIEDHITNFLVPNGSIRSINDYRSMSEYLNLEDKSHLIPEFIRYCTSLDIFRNENTKQTFPELENLWNQ